MESLGTHISFDGDYIFVGDACSNIGVLWLCDEEELRNKENMQDTTNVIKLKNFYSNRMSTNVVGVHSLRVDLKAEEMNQYHRLTQFDKQMLTLMTASEEGYIRIFQLREKKLLEGVA